MVVMTHTSKRVPGPSGREKSENCRSRVTRQQRQWQMNLVAGRKALRERGSADSHAKRQQHSIRLCTSILLQDPVQRTRTMMKKKGAACQKSHNTHPVKPTEARHPKGSRSSPSLQAKIKYWHHSRVSGIFLIRQVGVLWLL